SPEDYQRPLVKTMLNIEPQPYQIEDLGLKALAHIISNIIGTETQEAKFLLNDFAYYTRLIAKGAPRKKTIPVLVRMISRSQKMRKRHLAQADQGRIIPKTSFK
ncbi:hypothetical protein ACFLZP_00600, partial [Patescibacteria group bacterium]